MYFGVVSDVTSSFKFNGKIALFTILLILVLNESTVKIALLKAVLTVRVEFNITSKLKVVYRKA